MDNSRSNIQSQKGVEEQDWRNRNWQQANRAISICALEASTKGSRSEFVSKIKNNTSN
jgi:hypothetical protein